MPKRWMGFSVIVLVPGSVIFLIWSMWVLFDFMRDYLWAWALLALLAGYFEGMFMALMRDALYCLGPYWWKRHD